MPRTKAFRHDRTGAGWIIGGLSATGDEELYRAAAESTTANAAARLDVSLRSLAVYRSAAYAPPAMPFVNYWSQPMSMLSHTELRKGVKLEINGEPGIIVSSDFVKPGKGQAFTRIKVRSFITGNTLERTVKSNEKMPKADVEERNCQFLYKDGEDYHFMDSTSYDQLAITAEVLGDAAKWMEENMEARLLLWQGRAISVEPPNFVELEITECEPGIKGDTAQGGTKPVTLSTGAIITVPLFINQGEWVRIDTRTGEYMERVKK